MSNETPGVSHKEVERIAQIVAREVLQGLRDEVGEEVDKRLKAYLGDMTATQHSIQHESGQATEPNGRHLKWVLRRCRVQSYFFPDHRLAAGTGSVWRKKRHWKLRGKG